MFTTNTLSTNKSSLNYLISLMPLSLILGNLAINLNIIIICIIQAIYITSTFHTNQGIKGMSLSAGGTEFKIW